MENETERANVSGGVGASLCQCSQIKVKPPNLMLLICFMCNEGRILSSLHFLMILFNTFEVPTLSDVGLRLFVIKEQFYTHHHHVCLC